MSVSISMTSLTILVSVPLAKKRGLSVHASMDGATNPSRLASYGSESPSHMGRIACLGLALPGRYRRGSVRRVSRGSFGVPNGGNRILTSKREETP
jgi:hypothetical protein